MKIKFAKIPLAALFFYSAGFAIIGFCLGVFYSGNHWLSELRLQQLFIIGALVVTVGSAINIVVQFKKRK
ncbi:MAG TPA: hypothetical protein ENJ60_11530 [Aeromonadales bacterium]|nr:hypothetical protein [Aeromonadales bacterium]